MLDWLRVAAEEFQVFIGSAILPYMTNMTTYLEDLIKEIQNRKDQLNKELFYCDQENNPIMIDESNFANKSRYQDQILSEMQTNRILMQVGKRFSELLYGLRRLHVIVI